MTQQELPCTPTGQDLKVYFQGGIFFFFLIILLIFIYLFFTALCVLYRFHQEQQVVGWMGFKPAEGLCSAYTLLLWLACFLHLSVI